MTIKEFIEYSKKYGHLAPDKEALCWERDVKILCGNKTKLHHFTATERSTMLWFLEWAAAYWSLINHDDEPSDWIP